MLCYTTNMLHQGHDSAPGLDIMLLKQQFLGVSGQPANLARQHPPIEYEYRSSHPMLQSSTSCAMLSGRNYNLNYST